MRGMTAAEAREKLARLEGLQTWDGRTIRNGVPTRDKVKVRAFYIKGGSSVSAIQNGGYRLHAPHNARIGTTFRDPKTGKQAQVHAMGWYD